MNKAYGLEVVALRYFNIYGPRQDPEGPYAAVIPKFVDLMRAGHSPKIFGDGIKAEILLTWIMQCLRTLWYGKAA